jgi:predicted nucleic acid-binding protein
MTDLLPTDVYLDSGVAIAATFPATLYAIGARDLCQRLIQQGATVYFSQILRLEFTEAVRKLATIQGRVPPEVRRQFRPDDWELDVAVRRRWLLFAVDRLESLLLRFANVYEIPFERSIWLRSVEIMAERQLRSHDAIHLATAYENRLTCVATTDDEFLKVPDLDVRLIRDPLT